MDKKLLISNIKQQIVQRMKEHNLSTYSLEKSAGLSKGSVGNIVYDKSQTPRIDTLKAIADALDCRVDDLLLDAKNYSNDVDSPIINPSLIQDIVNIILSHIDKFTNFSLAKFLYLTQEAYLYSLNKKGGAADPEFIEWLIDQNSD